MIRPTLHSGVCRLLRESSGIAYTEFALTVPIFLTLALGGAEIANFVTTRMRVSQIALHLADHTARMGTGAQLAARTISESQINDVLTGAGLQSGNLSLYTNGRVIISSLEPVANPNTTNRYRIAWQRCRGVKPHPSSYGVAGATNLTGMGPAGRQVQTTEGGATMFVEVYYSYRPLIAGVHAPAFEMVEIGAMPVRERRDTSQIFNNEGAQASTCDRFTAA
jgi:hypothetical protein